MVILQTIFIGSSHPLRRTSLSSHNPSWHHQNPFLYCVEGMGISAQECVNVCVYVCVHPPCHSRSFPTECVPALCVCWLTGPKERQLFSTYPETLPCQVWDEILSIVLTPHSRASHSKTHTITAPGGRVIPCYKSTDTQRSV